MSLTGNVNLKSHVLKENKMAVINTNVAAQITANALVKNDREMTQAMERLATGSRINSASDDAAGLAEHLNSLHK